MQQETFDPYRKWFGIQPKDQPPNLYRLLGIDLFESDADVINHAADQRMIHVRTFQTGQHAVISQRILNEVAAAKIRLLDPAQRAEYDAELHKATAGARAAAAPPIRRGALAATGIDAVEAEVIDAEDAARAVDVDELVDTQSSISETQPLSTAEIAAASTKNESVETNETIVTEGAPRPARNGKSAASRPPAGKKTLPPRPGAAGRGTLAARGKPANKNLLVMLGVGGGSLLVIGVIAALLMRSNAPAPQTTTLAAVNPPAKLTPVVATPPPQLDAVAELTVRPGELLQQRITSGGGKIDAAYQLQLDEPPSGASLDDTGTLQWRPGANHPAGPVLLRLKLMRRDTRQVVANSSIKVRIGAAQRAPEILPIGDRTVAAGETLELDVVTKLADFAGAALKYQLVSGPGGATLDTAGHFRYRVASEVPGRTLPVVIRVTSREGKDALSSTQTFRILVAATKPSDGQGPTGGVGPNVAHGVKVEYFADDQFQNRRAFRTESRIDGFWSDRPPTVDLKTDRCAIRFTGWIQPPQTGNYMLTICCNGGFRAWLDDSALWDQWNKRGPQQGGSNQYFSGQPRALKLEYRSEGAIPIIRLQWRRPDGVQEIVPADAFYLDQGVAATVRGLPASTLKIQSSGTGLRVTRFSSSDFTGDPITLSPFQLDRLWGARFLGGRRSGNADDSGNPPGSRAPSWSGGPLSIRCEGFLRVPKEGKYELAVEHDGLAKLSIDGRVVIGSDAWERGRVRRQTNWPQLDLSRHTVLIEYVHEEEVPPAFALLWTVPGTSEKELIPITAFSHDEASGTSNPLAQKTNPSAQKAATPPSVNITRQAEGLKQEFAADFAGETPAARLALADKLCQVAALATTDDRRFAALSEARTLAWRAGNWPKMMQISTQMESQFQYDALPDLASALQAQADRTNSQEQFQAVARIYLSLLEKAYRTGRFLLGSDLLTPALSAASRSGDRDLKISINSVGKKLKELAPQEAIAEQARKTLVEDPSNAAARFQRGRYLALFQDNWREGLPLLAQGDNDSFRRAASADLLRTAQPGDATARKEVGDLWWSLQPFETDIARQRLRQRVLRWYAPALAGLADSARPEVENRLADIRRDVVGTIPREQPAPDVAREKPSGGSTAETKPLDSAGVRKVLQAILDAGGRVRVEGGDWLRRGDDLPHDEKLKAIGLVPARDTVDDTLLRTIGRLDTLQELVVDSHGITDAGMFRLKDLAQLTRLEITAAKVSDKSSAALERMTRLQTLKMQSEPFGGAAAAASLKGLSNLRTVEFTGERISDGTFTGISQVEGLVNLTLVGGHYQTHSIDKLQELAKLSRLTLKSRSVSTSMIARLGELKNLKSLTLEGPLGGSTLGELSKLNLEELTIIGAAVRDSDLQALGRMKDLRRVHLKIQPVSNTALAVFAELPKLRSLDVESASGVTDSGLQAFKKLENIEWVNLRGAEFGLEAYAKFKIDHPNATLSPNPEFVHNNGGGKNGDWKPKGGGGGGGGSRRPGPR